MYENLSAADLEQLFYNCVVRFNGIPVKITQTEGGGNVWIKSIAGGEYDGWVKITDKKFDFTPVPLGYATEKGYAYFLARRAVRTFSVGLTERSLTAVSVEGMRSAEAERNITKLNCKGIRNCILGKYPTVGEAFELLQEKDNMSIAIGRSFALDKDHRLYFRKNNIGVLDQTQKPVFFHSKNYMKVLWEE